MGKSSKPQVTTQSGNSMQVMQMPAVCAGGAAEPLGTGQSILSPYLNAGTSGYGVAGFNNDQQTAFQGVRDNYANAMAGGGGIGGADIQKFLNPYTQNVVDTTNQTLRDQNDITLNGIRARTAAASSFGGSGSRGRCRRARPTRTSATRWRPRPRSLWRRGTTEATATALASKQMDTAARQQAIQGLLSAGSGQQALEQTKLDVPFDGASAAPCDHAAAVRQHDDGAEQQHDGCASSARAKHAAKPPRSWRVSPRHEHIR
jgi:hypothetical protein